MCDIKAYCCFRRCRSLRWRIPEKTVNLMKTLPKWWIEIKKMKAKLSCRSREIQSRKKNKTHYSFANSLLPLPPNDFTSEIISRWITIWKRKRRQKKVEKLIRVESRKSHRWNLNEFFIRFVVNTVFWQRDGKRRCRLDDQRSSEVDCAWRKSFQTSFHNGFKLLDK